MAEGVRPHHETFPEFLGRLVSKYREARLRGTPEDEAEARGIGLAIGEACINAGQTGVPDQHLDAFIGNLEVVVSSAGTSIRTPISLLIEVLKARTRQSAER